MADIKDIWNNGKGKFPQDKLLAYLEGKLSTAEQHEVEVWLAAEGLEADAIEGLQYLPSEETKKIVGKLNYQLQHSLTTKKRRRTSPIKSNYWAWVAILIVLLLVIAAYIILRLAVN
jgi:hypothetical protein